MVIINGIKVSGYIRRYCAVEECGRPIVARGWCENHYRMWKRHGDPLVRGTAPGEAQRYLREIVFNYVGDDCLAWPFSKSGSGYGLIRQNERTHNVSRVVCIAVLGDPPTDIHEASHSCGNGHLGCVNPHHLSWKTPRENTQDKLLHGTVRFGRNHPNAKLDEGKVSQILELRGELSQSQIAKQFGVTQRLVSRILRGEAWRHVGK